MDLTSVFDFLRDPGNRAVLSWVGGGLAAVSGSLLAFRKAKKSPPDGTNTTTNVTSGDISRNAGVVNVGGTVRNVRIGYGLAAILAVGVVLLFLGIAASLLAGAFKTASSTLPEFRLDFNCSPDGTENASLPYQAAAGESDEMQKLLDFASSHDGQLVYFTLNVVRVCNACECQRAEYTKRAFLKHDHGKSTIFIASYGHDPQGNYDGFKWPQTLMISLFDMSHFGYGVSFYFPTAEQIPGAGFYSINQYGSYLYYQGPFVIHYDDGTGYAYAYLSPVTAISSELTDRITCTVNQKSLSFLDRVRSRCL